MSIDSTPGDPGPATVSAPELTERELAILAFERQWWRAPGSKDVAIRERFETSPTRYYQLVNALIDTEAALRHDPLLVKRLRRARHERRRLRRLRSAIDGRTLPATGLSRR